MNEIHELDVVALTRENSSQGLVEGQVGTVVEQLGDSAYEVEFSDEDGSAYASLGIEAEDLIVLHYSRVEAA